MQLPGIARGGESNRQGFKFEDERSLLMHATKSLGEVTPEDLGGLALADLKCRSCSGYGNCGYRMYRLWEGKPVIICQLRRQELLDAKAETPPKPLQSPRPCR